MAVSRITTKDICRIISFCHKYGVIEFKYDDLHMNLSQPAKLTRESTQPAAIPEEIQRQVSAEEAASTAMDEEKSRVADLLVTDPLEMERRIADGELIDEAGDN